MRKQSIILTALDTVVSEVVSAEARLLAIEKEIEDEEALFKHNMTVLLEERNKVMKTLDE